MVLAIGCSSVATGGGDYTGGLMGRGDWQQWGAGQKLGQWGAGQKRFYRKEIKTVSIQFLCGYKKNNK